MGTNTLPSRSDGVPITASWFNDIRTAMMLDWVPRNASGVPTDQGGSIGDANYAWLNGRFTNLYLGGTLVDATQIVGDPHRITVAAQDATTKYPAFLSPAGVAGGLSCDLLATATAFRAIINNITTNVSADTTFSSLTAAPAANNTCLVDDIGLTGAASTKTLGELDSKEITIDTIGAEISSLDGEIAAFLTGTEVFLALVDTSNTKLWPIYRGWAGTSRGALSNNDTITLLKFNALLIKNDGSTKVASLYYPETVTTSPAAGTAGKIYIERDTNKVGYDTGAAIDYSYMILGFAVCDDTDCLYADHWDMELNWKEDISFDFMLNADFTTITLKRNSFASVNGKKIRFFEDLDITTGADFDGGEALTAHVLHYLYMKQDGAVVISTVAPRKYCLIKKGRYHPLKYFRCVGSLIADVVPKLVIERSKRKSLENIHDEIIPIGTIVAWSGRYYDDGANLTTGSLYGTSIADLKAMLSEYWRVCDGSEIYDAESMIYNTAGRFIENLTDDRFLMGDTISGAPASSNTHEHVIAHAHQHLLWDDSGDDWYSLTSLDDSKSSITTGDTQILSRLSMQGGGSLIWSTGLDGGGDVSVYTTGVLSPPEGAAGATAASENVDHTPKNLSTFFIRKIK